MRGMKNGRGVCQSAGVEVWEMVPGTRARRSRRRGAAGRARRRTRRRPLGATRARRRRPRPPARSERAPLPPRGPRKQTSPHRSATPRPAPAHTTPLYRIHTKRHDAVYAHPGRVFNRYALRHFVKITNGSGSVELPFSDIACLAKIAILCNILSINMAKKN